jgi:hypothetical protein
MFTRPAAVARISRANRRKKDGGRNPMADGCRLSVMEGIDSRAVIWYYAKTGEFSEECRFFVTPISLRSVPTMSDLPLIDACADADGKQACLEALRNGQPRFFRAGEGRASGKTGSEDLEEFAEMLDLLQESSVQIGNQLEMNSVSHCVVFEEKKASAYRYDPGSDPRRPKVIGALVNRQIPVGELLKEMAEQ